MSHAFIVGPPPPPQPKRITEEKKKEEENNIIIQKEENLKITESEPVPEEIQKIQEAEYQEEPKKVEVVDDGLKEQIEETVEPPAQWFGHTFFKNKRERFGFIVFVLPIVIMSIVSMFALIDFFSIGHPDFTAVLLGVAFETASIATIAALVLLRKLNKAALWSIFVILYFLQLLGNVYAPFSKIDPVSASKLFDLFNLSSSELGARRIIALIQGTPLPTISFLMFKLTSSYFKGDEDN